MIAELARYKAVRQLACQFLSFCNSALHSLCTVCQHKLCTVCFKQVSALNTHGFRHGKYYSIASCSGCRSQTDTGISACRFYYNRIFIKQSLFLSVIKHCFGNPVLYAAGRVKVFQLCKYSCLKLILFFYIAKLQKRCASDQISYFFVNLHYNHTPLFKILINSKKIYNLKIQFFSPIRGHIRLCIISSPFNAIKPICFIGFIVSPTFSFVKSFFKKFF